MALDVPLDSLFDYLAPDATGEDVGLRVVVPFGNRRLVGVIMEVADQSAMPEERLKRISLLLRDVPPLPAEVLRLLRFCSEYYQHPLGEVVLNALPGRLRKPLPLPHAARRRFRLTPSGRNAGADELSARAVMKHRLLQALREAGSLSRDEAKALSPRAMPVLNEFAARGWVIEERDEATEGREAAPPAVAPPQLNAQQERATEEIFGRLAGGFRVMLLYGVTGSGKTEVYLRVMERVLAEGGQVLVLVPEINLTPQIEALFRGRFPHVPLATLHSGLSVGERCEHWLLAQAGRAGIILGTRLSVFTPMPRLRLIVVDEEHDSSFKQQEGLRYSARDVAVVCAQQRGIPILLGSATPSLESFRNALDGRYRLLTLSERAGENAALPEIRCIDTRRYKPTEGLSEPLVAALGARLARQEQSLLFINRRGYAPVLYCPQCAWVSPCPRCSAALVLHLADRRLHCHHCGHRERVPPSCPGCGNPDLAPLGQGTQRVEEALSSLLPEARIARIDRDSTRRRHAWSQMLGRVREGQVDILVGTQMLAKGHDFPRLTLVGVLNADGALYSADFRASERLFAQLMQVAGRAGRAALPGEVLIQTRFPDHPVFQALLRHDYTAFAKDLLAERRQAGFPPFVFQALLRAEASLLETAMDFLARAAAEAPRAAPAVTVYDPVPAPMARLAGKERAQLLVQSASRRALQSFLQEWRSGLALSAKGRVRWSLDVDPLEF